MKKVLKDVAYLINGALILIVIILAAEMALSRAQKRTEFSALDEGDFYAVEINDL